MRLTVQVLPDGPAKEFDGPGPIVVGRDQSADVVLTDARASRRHAVLRVGHNGVWVWEDGSANGTFLSGSRVATLELREPVVLELGDAGSGLRLRVSPQTTTPSGPAQTPTPRPVQRAPDNLPPVPRGPLEEVPRASLGQFSSVYEPASRLRIGRSSDNDIVLADLLVSRHHAELRSGGRGRYEVVDLSSANGTFLDGVRVSGRATMAEGAVLSIGHHLLTLRQGRLEEYIDDGKVSFAALDLSVHVGQKVLLDGVSFALDAGMFLAVLGPTGAGKSTLLKALIGTRPADSGTVLYNGRDVYASYAELRNRIGYVPQDDLLHQELTVRAALAYTAELRFPPDAPAEARERRVDEVMAELGLTARADLPVAKLSGGQRKRTCVGVELLTQPSLLVLDEPTSGLDPGYEKSVMELLRQVADGGRTVVTVTHSIQSLAVCDRVLFLAPGGQTAYFGPPAETLPFFGLGDYADVFQALDRSPAGAAKAVFANSPAAEKYVRAPLASQRMAQPTAPSAAPAASNNTGFWHQFSTLVRRYVAVIIADRRNTSLLLAQAPVLGLLMLLVFGSNSLASTSAANPRSHGPAGTVLVAFILAASYLGASNAIREVVKERGILTRDRAVGVPAMAYLLSKVVVLGALTLVQSVILVLLGAARQGGPVHGALLGSGRFELLLVVALTGLSSMTLGLFISSIVSNPDKAMTVLPVLLFAQFLFTGAVFNLTHKPVLDEIGFLAPARWGYSAAASTSNLNQLLGLQCNKSAGPVSMTCDPLHVHNAGTWLLDSSMLVVLGALFLGAAWLVLRPLGQPRRS